MANNQNRKNRNASTKVVVPGTDQKAPAKETPVEETVDQTPTVKEESLVETKPEVVEATKEEGVVTPATPAKVIKAASGEGVTPRAESSILTENLAALSFKLQMMDERMGKGKVFDGAVAGKMQKDLVEQVVNVITKVPPTEVRKAIGGLLDIFHKSEFINPSCLFKGVKNPSTKKLMVPDWWLEIGTMLSRTADPEVRFKIVGKEFTFDKVPTNIPPVVLTRLKEFFNA